MLRKMMGAVALLVMGLPGFAQQYNSNDVTPPGPSAGKLNGAATGKRVGGGSDGHAYLINDNSLAPVDLTPAGWFNSMAMSTDDTQQCGYGYSPFGGGNHAVLWSGSSISSIDLHTLFTYSYCMGNHNGQQVGFGERPVYISTTQHAMLWYGSAATVVDLHPIGYNYSKALGVHNGVQVGYASSLPYPGINTDTPGYHTTSHAMMWTGQAASFVDLHPLGYDASEALATNGPQQGGWVYTALGGQHAAMWSGTAASFVDLAPAGFVDSKVTALTDTQQVGEGWTGAGAFQAGAVRHALVWNGSGDTVVDLNQYLPAGYTQAVATGVDAAGNVVGYAYNNLGFNGAVPADAIAVVFAPGAAAPYALSSVTMSASNVAPVTSVTVTVTLSAAAPADGAAITFLSTDTTTLPTPASITIPGGQTSASFPVLIGGAALQVPETLKLYASDGAVRKFAAIAVTPVVTVSTMTVNAVEGGFSTSGTVTLGIPAQAGGAVISLTASNPTLVSMPASITIPQGLKAASFSIVTSSVAAPTAVTITASLNGSAVPATLSLTQAPVVSVLSITVPPVVGGQPTTGTLTLNNFPRGIEGAVVSLTSGDTGTLQVPATVTVPQYAYSVTFPITTTVVQGQKGVSIKAVYNGSTVTTTVSVAPIPTITVTQAVYLIDLQLLKISATTSFANSVLTFGTDPLAGAIGTMQFELGAFNGSAILPAAPAWATVWNSNGGMVTVPVTAKLSSAGSGGGGGGGGGGGATGGGGGGSTSGSFKLSISKTGKGTVTVSPNAASYAAGTVVTLTATPDPGFPWIGWAGACTGTSTTCTLTMNSNLSVTANFK